MPETEIPKFGALPPKYNFVMNPCHDIKPYVSMGYLFIKLSTVHWNL